MANDEFLVLMDKRRLVFEELSRIEEVFKVKLKFGVVVKDPAGIWVTLSGGERNRKEAKEYIRALCHPEETVNFPYPEELDGVVSSPQVHRTLERNSHAAILFRGNKKATIMGSALEVVMAVSALEDLINTYQESTMNDDDDDTAPILSHHSSNSVKLDRALKTQLSLSKGDLEYSCDEKMPDVVKRVILGWLVEQKDEDGGGGEDAGPAHIDLTQNQTYSDLDEDSIVELNASYSDDIYQTKIQGESRVPDNVRKQVHILGDGDKASGSQEVPISTDLIDLTVDTPYRQVLPRKPLKPSNPPNFNLEKSADVSDGADTPLAVPQTVTDDDRRYYDEVLAYAQKNGYSALEVKSVFADFGTILSNEDFIQALHMRRNEKKRGQSPTEILPIMAKVGLDIENDTALVETPTKGIANRGQRPALRKEDKQLLALTPDRPKAQTLAAASIPDLGLRVSRFEPSPAFRQRQRAEMGPTAIRKDEISPLALTPTRENLVKTDKSEQALAAASIPDYGLRVSRFEPSPAFRQRRQAERAVPATDSSLGSCQRRRAEMASLATDSALGSSLRQQTEMAAAGAEWSLNVSNRPRAAMAAALAGQSSLSRYGGQFSAAGAPNVSSSGAMDDWRTVPSKTRSDFMLDSKKHGRDDGRTANDPQSGEGGSGLLRSPSPKRISLEGAPQKSKDPRDEETLHRDFELSPNVHDARSGGYSGHRKLRYVVIDGSNVAMSHGNARCFSCRGIALCVDYFLKRGHREITVFVPQFRRNAPSQANNIKDQHILEDLNKREYLTFTPSRRLPHQKKNIVCYDDRFIIRLAVETDGIIVSNDNYRDLMGESNEFKEKIESGLLMFSFVRDLFMPPDDPLGRNGPNLDAFLSKPDPRYKTRSLLHQPHTRTTSAPHDYNINRLALHNPVPPTPAAYRPLAQGLATTTATVAPLQRPGEPNAWAATRRNIPTHFSNVPGGQKPPQPAKPKAQKPAPLLAEDGQVAAAGARSKNKTKTLRRELTAIFSKNEEKIEMILKNHPNESDLNKLSAYLLDSM